MLKILLVEDSAVDAELIELQLRAERLAVQIKRVQTRGEFVGALDTGAWDVVLADFMPTSSSRLCATDVGSCVDFLISCATRPSASGPKRP